ncbi:Holliday junction resolvase RuvX [bacterium]|nr:Holliday junction resolvase RuvX [candidate division CSSED10-310 bacterium]
MKRIIGLDYGTRRIGVAVSDPLRLTAQPVGTVTVSEPGSIPETLFALVDFNEIETAVIGLPLNMNGSEGESARGARLFASGFTERTRIPVVFWDERLSSRSAELAMLEDNVRRRKRKQSKDVIAAVIILQNYLDFLSG